MRAVLGTAVVVALQLVQPATANGPDRGRVCGTTCASINGYADAAPFTSWWTAPFTPRLAPRPAPYYRIVLRQFGPQPITWTLVYVPKRNMMRIAQSSMPPSTTEIATYWRLIPQQARAELARATVRIKPYRAPSSWRRVS